MQLKIAVFASGGGSNFRAIVENAHAYKVALLVSNRSRIGALEIARHYSIPQFILNPAAFAVQDAYVERLLEALREYQVNFIALAGYLRKIPAPVVRAFRGRMVNIHPAMLPAFGGKGYYGMRVHEAVLKSGVQTTGATVHFVDEEYDRGPIILQRPVPVTAGDTPATLARRVLEMEHQLYPETLHLIATGRVHLSGRTITLKNSD
ncbi:MAG: phosphoribosylglycinamide formyltransferase [Bacteroidota bacterium]|nr:phosphoribosylglycinamide formyltransferase [Bacteroidota bacterium]MDE2833258.1 phosphoribosylglycinamide formyltransferase [Bacteroidota bacterium]MDE2957583.1 phosphoribosylglycinamide formyltransferase [Bacteroidota bacterium]